MQCPVAALSSPTPIEHIVVVGLAAGCPQPQCRSQRFDLPREVVPSVRALAGSLGQIDASILPPGGFAYAVHQAMMDATEWDREFVARLATQGPRLQEPKMMRVGRFATTEEAGLLGDISPANEDGP